MTTTKVLSPGGFQDRFLTIRSSLTLGLLTRRSPIELRRARLSTTNTQDVTVYDIVLASSLNFDAWGGAGRRHSLRQIPRSVRGASPVPARNRQRGPNAFSMTQGNQIQWFVRGS